MALALPAAAQAKFYYLQGANVAATVEPDAAVRVSEALTFYFSGPFSGAYRDIPLREGESIDAISVAEKDQSYRPGGCTTLGCTSPPGTYGVERTAKRVRIVWHYSAENEQRVFTVAYRFHGLAVAYDDVVDVNLKVWGSEWRTSLSRLDASMTLPGTASGPSYRVWGHPATVQGTVRRTPTAALLSTGFIPPHQFVEMRVLFPRRLLSSTAGARVRAGNGLARIVDEEKRAEDRLLGGRRSLDDARDHLARTLLLLLLLALGPAGLVILGIWLLYGREPRTDYDREYEHEPPSDLPPAFVPPLLKERRAPDTFGRVLTATLFDLIQRGRFRSAPVTTERKTRGGSKTESTPDLMLVNGDEKVKVAAWEEPLVEILDSALAKGPERLSHLDTRIRENRAAQAARYSRFRLGLVSAVQKEPWYIRGGGKLIGWAVVAFLVAGSVLVGLGLTNIDSEYPAWSDILLITLGVCCFPNALITLIAAFNIRLWRKRRKPAQLEAERWDAFRRFLADFPRLEEVPPASLQLWEQYLVYGIAFGLAERVLEAAHLHMPQELHEASSLYWMSEDGGFGTGATESALSGLTGDLVGALTPVSTSSGTSSSSSSIGSSGFGGGFSGGGGSGGGGGGGGAW